MELTAGYLAAAALMRRKAAWAWCMGLYKVCGTEDYRQGLAALHKKLNALPNSAKSEAKFLLEVADSKDIRLKLVPLPRLMPAPKRVAHHQH